jgi:tRNA1(Val) A37 N6-methylase TrmN6
VRTNNVVLISAIEALLKGAEIPHAVLDRHMSVLEGSLGMLPRRIVVDDEHHDEAQQLLRDAGLAHELRLDPGVTETTDDAILGGRLRLKQMRRGHRVGHDAILLAAATDARAGDHAVDLGAGVGAAGLALAVRVPDVTATLVEIDPILTDIATANIAANGLAERVRAVTLDVAAVPEDFAAARIDPGSTDHVLMNPPFHDAGRQSVSSDPGRATAHAAPPASLAVWIRTAGRLLHSAGTLTMIWRADRLAEALAVLGPELGGIAILPVHGRAGDPAIRIVLRAAKGSRAPLTLLPGLNLNDTAGKPTDEAEAVLRHAQPLRLTTS